VLREPGHGAPRSTETPPTNHNQGTRGASHRHRDVESRVIGVSLILLVSAWKGMANEFGEEETSAQVGLG
jgi:hypothetical protein